MDNRAAWRFGYEIEEIVVDELRNRGFDAQRQSGRGADIIIRRGDKVISIEVKASARTKIAPNRCGYQFLLYKKNFSRRILEDFIIFVCVVGSGDYRWYVIPRSAIGHRNKAAIPDPDRYNGQWSVFRDSWDLIQEDLR